MFKPSAKLALVVLAVPLFSGFAAYVAAQVSTKPAAQVVPPGGPAADDKGGATKTVAPTTPNFRIEWFRSAARCRPQSGPV